MSLPLLTSRLALSTPYLRWLWIYLDVRITGLQHLEYDKEPISDG